MDARTIAEALGGKRSGGGYRSACPVCGGSENATKFSIRDAHGTVLIRCFAGCDQINVIHALRDMGLWPKASPDQRKQWSDRKLELDMDHAETYVMVAESALGRGEKLSAWERRKLFVSRKLIEAYHGQE